MHTNTNTPIRKMELVFSPPKIPAFLPAATTTCSSYNTNHNKLLPNTALTNFTISASRSRATDFIHASNPNSWSGTSRAATPSPPSPPDPDKLPTPPPDLKTLPKSLLVFCSGWESSSGLLHGMEGIMENQTRDLDFEDDSVNIYSVYTM